MVHSKHSEFFELVHDALADGVETLEAGKTLTTRDVEIPDPPADTTIRDHRIIE